MKIETAARSQSKSKVSRPTPETLRQAQTWDAVKVRYLRAGFCEVCAAQAAWGHQLGFSHVNNPCHGCIGKAVPDRSGVRASKWALGSTVEEQHDGWGSP